MNKIIPTLFLLIFCAIYFSGCGPKIEAKEGGGRLANSMCAKQKECLANPAGAYAMNICVDALSKAYPVAMTVNGYKKVKVEQMEKCELAIAKLDCAKFNMATMPTDCPFIRGMQSP